LLFPRRGSPVSRGPTPRPERLGGELVRDPNCGTYIPKANALIVGSGANTQYFCSRECRDAYAIAHVGHSTPR